MNSVKSARGTEEDVRMKKIVGVRLLALALRTLRQALLALRAPLMQSVRRRSCSSNQSIDGGSERSTTGTVDTAT